MLDLFHDFELTVADISISSAEEKIHNHKRGRAIAFDISNVEQRIKEIDQVDIVISLLPPALHYLAAFDCVHLGKHLVTASYVSPEIKALHDDAIQKNILLLNECGLDPGIDHMSAMEIIHRLQKHGAEIKSFKSYTGGLVVPCPAKITLRGFQVNLYPHKLSLLSGATNPPV